MYICVCVIACKESMWEPVIVHEVLSSFGMRLGCQTVTCHLSCQPWTCQCINQRSLRCVWVPRQQGGMTTEVMHLPVEGAGSLVDFWAPFKCEKANDKKLRVHGYRHTERCVFVSGREVKLRGRKWLGMYWHLTDNRLERIMKHLGGCSAKKKGLDSRNGCGSNYQVSFRDVTPFIDTHDTLNSSPESNRQLLSVF